MKKLYEVTSLSSAEVAFDRFEVLAQDLSEAYQMAYVIFREELPPIMWIGPTDQDWYVIFKNTEKNMLTNNVIDASFVHAQRGSSLQN